MIAINSITLNRVANENVFAGMAADSRDFEERRNTISGFDVVFDEAALDDVQGFFGDDFGPEKLTSRPRECRILSRPTLCYCLIRHFGRTTGLLLGLPGTCC